MGDIQIKRRFNIMDSIFNHKKFVWKYYFHLTPYLCKQTIGSINSKQKKAS